MDILFCIVSLILVIGYWVREQEHEQELKDSYEKGYKKGLYENVVKFSKD